MTIDLQGEIHFFHQLKEGKKNEEKKKKNNNHQSKHHQTKVVQTDGSGHEGCSKPPSPAS